MTWSEYHAESERLASEAELAKKHGDTEQALNLYRVAADAEVRALSELDSTKARTFGITLVSAVALFYKARDYEMAKSLAQEWLVNEHLPAFARNQVRQILAQINGSPNSVKLLESSNGESGTLDTGPFNVDSSVVIATSNSERPTNISVIRRLLWLSSGASISILQMEECRAERDKYAAIGLNILFTSALAGLSGGYALNFISGSVAISVLFGVIWVGVVFNLDRYIVQTIKNYSFWRQLTAAIPRIIMAALIVWVVIIPIQLKLFQYEIDNYLATQRIENADRAATRLNSSFSEINELRGQNANLEEQLQRKQEERDNLYSAYIKEAEGTGGARKPGKGPMYYQLKEQLTQIQRELDEQRLRSYERIEQNNRIIGELTERRDAELKRMDEISNGSSSFLARINALNALSSENTSFALARWSILLLFFFLSITPIMVKLLSPYGPYDAILDRIEHEAVVKEKKKISDLEMQEYIESEVNKQIRRIILETGIGSKDSELANIQEEFAPKISSEMNRRLTEKLNTLINVLSDTKSRTST